MAEAFRKNTRVKGIVINGKEIKLSQYADDTTSMLNCSEESLKESLNLLDTFGKAPVHGLWSDKGDKIKRNDYLEGGIKMIDIFFFNKSLKATWI